MTRRLIIALCCFVSIHLQAQHSFSVNEAQDFGLLNNRDVKNAALDVDIASKQMLETISEGLPQINAEGTMAEVYRGTNLITSYARPRCSKRNEIWDPTYDKRKHHCFSTHI